MIPSGRRLLAALAILVLMRFGLIAIAGWDYAVGDFLHSLPGPHVETLNPALWTSADLAGAGGYDIFVYGPTQHLTLLPLTWSVESYRVLARILLVTYAAMMLGMLYLLVKTFEGPSTRPSELWPVLAIAILLFPPATQAFLQREFEVVIAFAYVTAAWSLVSGRDVWAGALMGYITWFKGFPVVTVAFLLSRRRFSAAVAYIAASGLVLGTAHLVFGLQRFRDMVGWGTHFLQSAVDRRTGFCEVWNAVSQTQTNLQFGLCGLSHRWPWLPAAPVFYGIVAAVVLFALQTFIRFERAACTDDMVDRWRTIWELGLLAIAMTFFIHNEYYYLILLVFPLSALASRYWIDETWRGPKRWLLLAAFVLLGTFIIAPTTPFMRLLNVSGWHLFTDGSLYVYGGLTLIGLVLWEYHALAHATYRSRGNARVA